MSTSRKVIRFRWHPASPSVPSYISSMSAFQVRMMSGSYAPTNGTSTLAALTPNIWPGSGTENRDIMDPWSGGAKSIQGTKMYVHGGGHGDSENNGVYSFDFAGTTRPTGWLVENDGQLNVVGDVSVGGTGYPISVHTYDGMVDMGTALYRIGGASYPNGFLINHCWRYLKASGVWTRIPSYPDSNMSGMAIGNPTEGKILAMDRWYGYFTYAFYRVASNAWSALKTVGSQWPNYPVAAYNPANNTGLVIDGSTGFTISINWSAETIIQSARSLTSMGQGASLVWDPTLNRYWRWGGGTNITTIHEINPADWSVTAHTLSGNTSNPNGDYQGSFGRFVFMNDFRAIGAVNNVDGSAFVIKLPS